ncbi:MAG: hypothetical protein IPK60_19765 [Sandaracinaceae bacterium]|nr:hypothetical protein [Sandaracinaceae bacterium]
MRILLAVSMLAAVAGCSGGATRGNNSGGPLVPSTDNPRATCDTPRGPWGFSIGRLQQPWTVANCEGAEYDLYNNDFCGPDFTVVVHSEPWCGECIADAPSMKANLIDPYASMNVRILEVLQQDINGGPVDADTCTSWGNTYETPGYVFMDPTNDLSTYNYRPGTDEEPAGSRTEGLPVVNIYDATGTLVFHHEGATNRWRDITDALDDLIAAQ